MKGQDKPWCVDVTDVTPVLFTPYLLYVQTSVASGSIEPHRRRLHYIFDFRFALLSDLGHKLHSILHNAQGWLNWQDKQPVTWQWS